MTPKQKAEELVDKFTQTNGNAFFAKECALIAVDELIKATEDVWFLDGNYWEDVKKEIENMKGGEQ